MGKSTTIVGLDVHKKAVTAALLLQNAARPREVLTIENEPTAMARFVKRVAADHHSVTFVYEAGPCGYAAHRQITSLGCRAVVVAPALIPIRPGDRVKTNRRDAEKLARLYRAGQGCFGNRPTSYFRNCLISHRMASTISGSVTYKQPAPPGIRGRNETDGLCRCPYHRRRNPGAGPARRTQSA